MMSNFNPKTTTALLKKELSEHKVAFIYVPAILITIITLTFSLGLLSNGSKWREGAVYNTNAIADFDLFNLIYAFSIFGWLIFMLLMLFFYFAGSFSADRKDNALLFWKSMPVSDLQIMSTKTLAGLLVFPVVILAWTIIAAIVGYIVVSLVTINYPIIASLNSGVSLTTFLNLQGSVLVVFALTLLWYLPLFAAVGLLGTLLRGWAVPAFILILMMVSAVEALVTLSGEGYFSSLMGERFDAPFTIISDMHDMGPLAGAKISELISFSNFVPAFASAFDWVGMILGWVVAGIFIFIASEYRRRRIGA